MGADASRAKLGSLWHGETVLGIMSENEKMAAIFEKIIIGTKNGQFRKKAEQQILRARVHPRMSKWSILGL